MQPYLVDGIIHFHNQHQWVEVNPHGITEIRYQQQFKINVWVSIISDVLVDPYVSPKHTGDVYGIFLRETLSGLVENVPLDRRYIRLNPLTFL